MLYLGNIDVQGLWEWRQVAPLCELKSRLFTTSSSLIVHLTTFSGTLVIWL